MRIFIENDVSNVGGYLNSLKLILIITNHNQKNNYGSNKYLASRFNAADLFIEMLDSFIYRILLKQLFVNRV